MKVRLLQAHYFHGDRYHDKDVILGNVKPEWGEKIYPLPDFFECSPDMEGLDDEGKKAVEHARKRYHDPMNMLPRTMVEERILERRIEMEAERAMQGTHYEDEKVAPQREVIVEPEKPNPPFLQPRKE
jgi:hypothetical protein